MSRARARARAAQPSGSALTPTAPLRPRGQARRKRTARIWSSRRRHWPGEAAHTFRRRSGKGRARCDVKCRLPTNAPRCCSQAANCRWGRRRGRGAAAGRRRHGLFARVQGQRGQGRHSVLLGPGEGSASHTGQGQAGRLSPPPGLPDTDADDGASACWVRSSARAASLLPLLCLPGAVAGPAAAHGPVHHARGDSARRGQVRLALPLPQAPGGTCAST